MPFEIHLPAWGMGMNDGLVVRWLRQEGDRVEKGEPLVEIESAKVTGEVESTGAGTLARIVVPEGMTVPTGSLLGVVLAPDEAPEGPLPPALRPETRSRSPAPAASRRGGSQSGLAIHRVVSVQGLRATIARRLTESWRAPHVTLATRADVAGALSVLARLRAAWRRHRMRPHFQDLAIKAAARALVEHPRANAYLVGDEIRELAEVNIAVAVATPDGLLVPVVRNADRKNVREVAQEVRTLARRVKSGDWTVEDMTGSTFTITNLGAFGIDAFSPILNPPEVGILALGRTRPAPVVHNGEIAIRTQVWMAISFDHRAWDGAAAAEFLQKVVRYAAAPEWMLDE